MQKEKARLRMKAGKKKGNKPQHLSKQCLGGRTSVARAQDRGGSSDKLPGI